MSERPQWNWPSLDHATAATLLGDAAEGMVGELDPIGHGDFCLAFRAGTRIVRVTRHREAAVALRREACVLAAIADALPVTIPRPTYHCLDRCPPFTIHDEVTGELLTRADWTAMSQTAQDRVAADLAGFLNALHALPVDIGRECSLTALDSTALARRLRSCATTTLYPLLEPEHSSKLDAMLGQWSSSSAEELRPRALLHCDIAPGHLLYDRVTGALTGVIDFGDVAISDPARDFIYIYEDYGPPLLTKVLCHYAHEETPLLLGQIHKWYLLEAISWTLDMCAAKRSRDIEHGLAEIVREVAMFPRGWETS